MKLRLFIFTLLISSFFVQKSWAQDPEFSQFYAAPSHVNPAMIGFFEEARIVMNYRHQYPSFDNAYLTLGVSYDQHFSKINSSFGLSILADRAGAGIYNTYFVSGLYAYQLQLNDKLFLKTGFQLSYLQQYVNWGDLVFTDMLNPLTGEVFAQTNEFIPDRSSIHRLDLSGGILLFNDRFYAGASFKHVTNPNLSFSDSGDASNNIGIRTAFHVGHVFYLGKQKLGKSQFYVSPNLLVANQGRFFQFTGGAYAGKGAIYGGLWYRHTISNPDALIVLLGVKAGVFKIGYSYDFNVASTGTTTGAHEVSVSIDMGQTRWAEKRRKQKANFTCPAIFGN